MEIALSPDIAGTGGVDVLLSSRASEPGCQAWLILVWQGVREHKGWIWIGAGVIALGLYGFVATLQPDPHFGRVLAACGGIFVAGSLAWD
jgi:drug/metabolite transporter superfamily protein YnfA